MKILPIVNFNTFKNINLSNNSTYVGINRFTQCDTYNGIAFEGKNKKKKKKEKSKKQIITLEEMMPKPKKTTAKGFVIPEKPSVESLINSPFQRDLLNCLCFRNASEEEQNKVLDGLEHLGNMTVLKDLLLSKTDISRDAYLIDSADDSITERLIGYVKDDREVLDVYVNDRDGYSGDIHLNSIARSDVKRQLINIVTSNYEKNKDSRNLEILSKMLLTKNKNGELPIQYMKNFLIDRNDEKVSFISLIDNATSADKLVLKSEKEKVEDLLKKSDNVYDLRLCNDKDEELKNAVRNTADKIYEKAEVSSNEQLQLALLDAALLNNDVLIYMLEELSESKSDKKFTPYVKDQIIKVANVINEDLAVELDKNLKVEKEL